MTSGQEVVEENESSQQEVGVSSALHSRLAPIVTELNELEMLSTYLLWIKKIRGLRYIFWSVRCSKVWRYIITILK